ncbi:IPT/TIG domain-containing protein [Chitinophaga deserti]|uniref:IPT/TIG domain-containing protein n=1 Tax=Chitinophaga deserti TaxID=2164099 RepID=UPI0018E57401|nr:IPT/TIG domain-containing protein [Chitinophaga deserti]
MKRNHLLVIICMMLTTVLSCKKKDKVEIDLNNAKTPEITGFTPGHAVPGTTVTVTGKNFSTNIPENELRLNNERMWVKTATATTLTFDVPFAATTGKLSITINNKTFTTTTNFTVDPIPVGISTIDPLEGPFDTEVTISGREFPADPIVTINGVIAPRVSWSSQQIKFKIPYNTGLTKHKIKVEGDGKNYESAQEFTVTAPGKYAKWTELPPVGNAPTTNYFPHGNAFVHNKKVYWGFSAKLTGGKDISYGVFDPADRGKGWQFFSVNGLPEGLQSTSVSVLGDKMYIGNGIPVPENSKWWSFNLLTKVLEPVTRFPAAQASMGIAFTFKGVMYAGSGLGDKDIYAFNPANNGTWTKVVDDPYAQIDGGNVVVLENEVIVGRALKAMMNVREAVYKFSINNTTPQLTQVANIPDGGQVPSQRMPAFALNGKVYYVINKRVWEYDPARNAWRMVIEDQISPLIRHTVVIDGKLYAWTARGVFYEFSFLP